jgi:hypothetical protein
VPCYGLYYYTTEFWEVVFKIEQSCGIEAKSSEFKKYHLTVTAPENIFMNSFAF